MHRSIPAVRCRHGELPWEQLLLTISSPADALLGTATAAGTIMHRRKGDLNGDGHADVLWQHTDGRIQAWLMSGLTRIESRAITPNVPAGWDIVGVGDFNNDGMQDLVWQHTTGTLSAWLLHDTTLQEGAALTPSNVSDANWRIRGVGDLNGDGWQDLYWHHATAGHIAWWQMNGLTRTAEALLNPSQVPDLQWSVRGVADFNSNNKVDLVWQHLTQNILSAWLMDGATQVSGEGLTPSTVSAGWRIEGVADFNLDGKPDLLWHNASSGLVSVWLMNGLVMVEGNGLTPSAMTEAGWRVVGPK